MSANKNHQFLIIILLSLTIGYIVKITLLPASSLKYIISIVFSIYLLLLPFSKKINHIELPLFSLIIFWFESIIDTNVPYIIYLSESGIKIITPLIIYFYLNNKPIPTTLLKTGICLTFIAHGLLATNIITTPESFYLMIEKILCFNNNQTIIFLFIVGVFDILFVLFLFETETNAYKFALYYCIIWAFITAIARTIYVYDASVSEILSKGIAETLIRLPNSIIPFILLQTENKQSVRFYE